ncbi:MAG: ATP-binding cassette domain-containing protein [Patescibacteria group bacterium]|nr:ATP-binding cassette domain-containing protein [Patescibacteria group bacterium]
MLVFKIVSKIYQPDIKALEKISFEVKAGEFVILVGRSGAGKSTILKLIRKEENPTEGHIFYKNLDYTKIRGNEILKLRRKVVIVFQDFKLLNDRTVYDNIRLPLEAMRFNYREIRKKIEEVLKSVDLWNHKDILAKFLSGGEKQRLSIARALSTNPEILLADEPTGNLDPISSFEIAETLKNINNQGVTIILATHHKDIVDYLNKRVITIHQGRIVKDENPGKYTLI